MMPTADRKITELYAELFRIGVIVPSTRYDPMIMPSDRIAVANYSTPGVTAPSEGNRHSGGAYGKLERRPR